MNSDTKEMLLALIKGLTTYEGSSQYDCGTPCIKGRNLDVLINTIKNSQEELLYEVQRLFFALLSSRV